MSVCLMLKRYTYDAREKTQKIRTSTTRLRVEALDWWRRGESDPCPKIHPRNFLRVHPSAEIPNYPRKRRSEYSVAFLCVTAISAN